MMDGHELLRMIDATPGDRIIFSKDQARTIAHSIAMANVSGAMLSGQRRMDATIASLQQLAG